MAARTTRTQLSDEWKEKIKAGVILDKLLKHVNGEINMANTQVKAADILLKKVIPDLSKSDIDANVKGKMQIEILKQF